MKFKQIHRLTFVAFVLCHKIIRGDDSESKKWHMIQDFLFYIDVEQKVNQ